MAGVHRILVVDDEEALSRLLTTELQSEGYSVIAAGDGDEALSVLEKEQIDLMFLDIRMPRVDGFEVLRIVQKRWPETKVLMLSAYGDVKNAIESLRLGAMDFISKPYDIRDILNAIRQIKEKDGLVIDIERHNKLMHLLESQINSLQEQNSSLSEFTTSLSMLNRLIAGLSHSVKGELANINATISEIKTLAKGNPEIAEECGVISRSADFAQLLLIRMIYFTTRLKVRKTAIDPADIAEKVNELITPRVPSKVRFNLAVAKNLTGTRFFAGREEVLVVLTELIGNSIAALRNTGGEIWASFEIAEDKIKISVADNGPGIPKEIRESLFSDRVLSKRGLGMGLYLCSKIVSSMDGMLDFASEDGKGTTFSLLLPLERSSEDK